MGWNDIEVGCAVRCDVDGSIGVVCFDAGRNGVKLCREDGEIQTDEFGYDVLHRHSKLTRLRAQEAAKLPWIADCWASWLRAGGGSAEQHTVQASSSSAVDHSSAAERTDQTSGSDADGPESSGGEALVTDVVPMPAPPMDDAEDWRAGVNEDWRAGLSDVGRHLCEQAEDGSDEEAARAVPHVREAHDEDHESEEEYEAALRAAGDQLDDLRYLRNELSPAGILALMDEEHKQELWEREQLEMKRVGLRVGPAAAFRLQGEPTHAEQERQQKLHMRERWEAQQRARGKIGASMALVAAGRYMQKRRTEEQSTQQNVSAMALSKEISEEAYMKLHAQYKATKRLDLSDVVYSGLTDAGLMELPSLFPAVQELFYDRQRVEAHKIGALVKKLPQLRCGYLGGLLHADALDAAREQYHHTRELDLTAAMQAGAGVSLALLEAALAELPGLFPKLEALFLPKAVATMSMREQGQKKQREQDVFTPGHSFAGRTQELRELRWKASSQQTTSHLSPRRADAAGETVALTEQPQWLQLPLEAHSADWFFDREKRPTLKKDKLIEASMRDRTCPDLATMENRTLASLWDRCLLDACERAPYEDMARRDQERYAAETQEFGEYTVILPAAASADFVKSVTVRSFCQSHEREKLNDTVNVLTKSNDHSVSSPGITGPMLELFAATNTGHYVSTHGSIGTVSITFDGAMMMQQASGKLAAVSGGASLGCQRSQHRCVLLVLRQQDDGSPWLPLHESESVTLDSETSQVTIHLRWLGRVTTRLFHGPCAAEHAAIMAGNALAHAAAQMKDSKSANNISTLSVVKYAALSACQTELNRQRGRRAATNVDGDNRPQSSGHPTVCTSATGGLCGVVLERNTGTAEIFEEITNSTRSEFDQALHQILEKATWCTTQLIRETIAAEEARDKKDVDTLHGLRVELEPHVVTAGLTWQTLSKLCLQFGPAPGQSLSPDIAKQKPELLVASDTTSHTVLQQQQRRDHVHLFQHAIAQLKAQLPSLKVAYLGCEITHAQYKMFAAEYVSKQSLEDVWTGCYSDDAIVEMRELWPYTEQSEMSRLKIALSTNAKLKQRNSEVEKALVEAARERLERAVALKEREELLAQMLARSSLEGRYAQVAAADLAVRQDSARYQAMIAEKEARLSDYRRQIADQETVMRERETQLLNDLQRLKDVNATLDKLQGQPLSLLPVPQQLTQHLGTTLAPLPPATRLAVGSPAAIAFKAACLAAQATVTPEQKFELAQITLKMAKTGDEAAICAALEQGADPNSANERDADETVLYFAAKAGNAGCVAALLAAGASVDRGGNDGWTPLMHAVNAGERECIEVCRLLLDAGANIAAADSNSGHTALDLAIENVKHADAEDEGDEEDKYDETEEDGAKAHTVVALLRSVNAPSGTDL